MKEQLRTFPFRWVLPATQLFLCFLSLWPSRYFILFEVSQAIEPYAPIQSKKTIGPVINIEIPTLTPEQQDAADRATKIEDLRMRVPLALNFPVFIAQLPYVIASPAKREWIPNGMMIETWREISWPFAGLLFWWSIGRGIEALRSTRKAVISPRVTLVETAFAAVFVCIGVAVLVGTVMSTPDDRRDVHFMALMAGGLLWGILASITIAARIFQWRIRRRAARGKRLNLVMTLKRKGPNFPSFLQEMLSRMAYGDTMPVAWNDICPQIPRSEHRDAPESIFFAGRGGVRLLA